MNNDQIARLLEKLARVLIEHGREIGREEERASIEMERNNERVARARKKKKR